MNAHAFLHLRACATAGTLAVFALIAATVGMAATSPAPASATNGSQAAREFQFSYSATIPIPEGTGRARIWVPYPESDPNQVVSDVRVSAPVEGSLRTERKYGNKVLFIELDHPRDPVALSMTFTVLRREHVNRPEPKPAGSAGSNDHPDPAIGRYLEPDHLVPLDAMIRDLAREVTKGRTTPLARARAIYDYTVSTMKYDKSGTGWGNGDIHWACDARRGNCTDFHALFIGLCRAAGIPARFSIGFPIPADRGQGPVGGYHCWAEFYLSDRGWVPVDASEAAKNPGKRDYYFGAHDENRVQLSTGRDLVLDPPQAGDPLNYFIYPYVEIDGKPVKDLTKQFAYRDLEAPSPASSGPIGS